MRIFSKGAIASSIYRAAGPSFNPADYGTVYGWWDASQQTGYSDTNNVNSATDFSGNGRTLTQGTSTKQPVYNTGVQNGLAVFTFDGGDALIHAGSSNQGQPWTAFFVMKCSTSSPTANQFFMDSESDSADRNAFYTWYVSAASDFSLYAGTEQSSEIVYTTNPVIACVQFNGTSSFIRINGSQSANLSSGINDFQPLTLGNRYTDNEGIIGWMGEAFLYNSAISGANISSVEGELSSKWGITI